MPSALFKKKKKEQTMQYSMHIFVNLQVFHFVVIDNDCVIACGYTMLKFPFCSKLVIMFRNMHIARPYLSMEGRENYWTIK